MQLLQHQRPLRESLFQKEFDEKDFEFELDSSTRDSFILSTILAVPNFNEIPQNAGQPRKIFSQFTGVADLTKTQLIFLQVFILRNRVHRMNTTRFPPNSMIGALL